MTTATITNTVVLPDGTTPSNVAVRIQLIGSTGTPLSSAYVTATGAQVDGLTELSTSTGTWSATLQLNSGTNLTPGNTQYQVTQTVFNAAGHSLTYVDYISVTASGTLAAMLSAGAPASLTPAGAQTYTDSVRPLLVAASNAPAKWKAAAAYVATGTNDQVLINSVLTSDKVVVLSPGTFSISLAAHPVNANYQVGVILVDGCSLLGSGKSTILQMAANQPSSSASITASMIYNNQINGGDSNITISDLTLDGNNLNQGTAVQNGVGVLRARGVHHSRLRAINFRGTAVSGFAETFFFESGLSTDVFYNSCEAVGTAGSTATGFSADQATNVRYTDCAARGMSVTHGFTHNTCGNVTYTGCHAYSNGTNGFNSEVSHDVLYENCFSGGTASAGTSWPYTASQSLGNTNAGYNIVTGTRVRAVNCHGNNNAFGFYSTGGTNNEVLGGVYTGNTYGINTDAGTTVAGRPFAGGNSNTNLITPGGNFAGEGGSATPAVPASAVAYTNQFSYDCTVYITGGPVTAVAVGGNTTGLTGGAFRVPAGATITLTYTAAPTWVWILGG